MKINNKIFFTEKAGKFILPISRNGFTINDNNSEFSDGFFVDWTYPLELNATDELIRIFGDFTDPNFVLKKKFDEGFLNVEGKIYPAKLKYITAKNKNLKIQFELGLESLPVFEKKLSEFNFETVETTNIYDYVDSILNKTYPETNFCFPAVVTNKFEDKAGDAGFAFNGCYNFMNAAGVVRNVNTSGGYLNQNILKPYVFLLHVLKTCFSEALMDLQGDILEDEDFKKSALNHTGEFFEITKQIIHKISTTLFYDASSEYSLSSVNKTTVNTSTVSCFGNYTMSVLVMREEIRQINFKASWKDENNQNQSAEVVYAYNNEPTDFQIHLSQALPIFNKATEVKLRLEIRMRVPPVHNMDMQKTVDAYLNPPNPNQDNEIFLPLNKIDLKKYLPDMTFRTLLLSIKKWKNYKLIPGEGTIYMNLVDNTVSDIEDISKNDVRDYEIQVNSRESYIMKHGAPEEYEFLDQKFDKIGFVEEGKDLQDDYAELIEINGYPLPQELFLETQTFSLTTATEKAEENGKMCLIKYDGLQAGVNSTLSLDNLRISNIHPIYYKLWMRNRIEAVKMRWTFFSNNPALARLSTEKKLGAYKNIHKIITIVKKFIGEDAYQVEIESENRP